MLCRSVVIALMLSLPIACGGGGGKKMQKIEVPAEGVRLGYDLTPNQIYKGKVKSSESVVGTTGNKLARSFSFDVVLTIRGPVSDGPGGTLVMARYSNIEIRWGLPANSPFSLSEFVSDATKKLQGLEVTFHVDESGKILYMPELPEDMAPELRFLLQEAIDTLETAFLTVQQKPLKAGDTWSDDKNRGRKGKLGRYLEAKVTTKVDGFFRDETTDLTRLSITESEKEVTTAKTGSHEVTKETSTIAYFAHSDQYLRTLSRDRRTFDPGVSTTFAKIEVEWTKAPPPQGADAAMKQVQDIDNPCHPDYVGGEECASETPAEPEAAPADPEAAPALAE